MKNCQNCGQEIPKESNFCPYCMEKFVVGNEDENLEVKKNHKRLFVMAVIVCAVTAILVVLLCVLGSKEEDASNGEDDSKESVTSEGEETTKPSDYEGVWYDAACMDASTIPEQNGGYELIIYSIEDEQILFSLWSYQASPASRIAQVEYIKADIEDDGVVEFQYEDDGWGNKGKGQIKLGFQEVEVSIQITSPDENAMWSLRGDVTFKKSANEVPDKSRDFLGLIGRDYYDVINVMGLSETGSELDEYSGMYHYLEDDIRILEENSTIYSVYIDYSDMNAYERGNYKFSEFIDGNSTYGQIEKNMGEITSTLDYNGENITCFKTKETLFETYLKVTFRDGVIQNIYYFIPIT